MLLLVDRSDLPWFCITKWVNWTSSLRWIKGQSIRGRKKTATTTLKKELFFPIYHLFHVTPPTLSHLHQRLTVWSDSPGSTLQCYYLNLLHAKLAPCKTCSNCLNLFHAKLSPLSLINENLQGCTSNVWVQESKAASFLMFHEKLLIIRRKFQK